jgi:hypothetical protein
LNIWKETGLLIFFDDTKAKTIITTRGSLTLKTQLTLFFTIKKKVTKVSEGKLINKLAPKKVHGPITIKIQKTIMTIERKL